MPVNKGYLIPENAQPADTRCLRVFVPDDPLYIAAFLGALTYFGQWTAWERDEQKRGQFAANAWREANEETLDGLSFPCSDNPITEEEMSEILDKLDDVISRLTELEDMDIIVNQTVNGCGCGCDGETTSTTQTTSGGIIIDPEDTGVPVPYDTEQYVIVDSLRCRASNYLAVSVVGVLRRLGTMGVEGGSLIALVGIIVLAVTVISPVLGDEVIAWSVFLRWAWKAIKLRSATAFTATFFNGLADRLEDDLEGLVCTLYVWDTAEELGAKLIAWVSDGVDSLQSTFGLPPETVALYKEFLNAVYGAEMINWFVANIDNVTPSGFVAQYDCLCGATGDSCPTANLMLTALGNLPNGDLTGTTQGFGSQFNSTTGYYEIIFELAANYCVTIENGAYTPEESHEKCAGGVMVPSDGSCIRRFVARSQTPFGTAVTFNSQTVDCACLEPEISCINMETQEGVDGIKYSVMIDDTNEEWNVKYRLRTFGGVTSAIVSGAILQISLINPRAEQTGTVISIGVRASGVWEYHEIVTAGGIGSGGLFPVSFPAVNIGDVWSGDVEIFVKNSSGQPMDVIPPQEIRFGTLCLHGN